MAGRLKTMLQAQQANATRNATAQQQVMLHVAPPRECNTQQPPQIELRSLVEAIAKASPHWLPADVEEAVAIGNADLANALTCYRELAVGYGLH